MLQRQHRLRSFDATDCLARRWLCDDSQSASAARGSKGVATPLQVVSKGGQRPPSPGNYRQFEFPVGSQTPDDSYPG